MTNFPKVIKKPLTSNQTHRPKLANQLMLGVLSTEVIILSTIITYLRNFRLVRNMCWPYLKKQIMHGAFPRPITYLSIVQMCFLDSLMPNRVAMLSHLVNPCTISFFKEHSIRVCLVHSRNLISYSKIDYKPCWTPTNLTLVL